ASARPQALFEPKSAALTGQQRRTFQTYRDMPPSVNVDIVDIQGTGRRANLVCNQLLAASHWLLAKPDFSAGDRLQPSIHRLFDSSVDRRIRPWTAGALACARKPSFPVRGPQGLPLHPT